MAIDTTLLTNYTAAQLRLMLVHAMATLATGGKSIRMPDGRMIERATKEDLEFIRDYVEAMESSSEENGGIILGGFGEPA